MFKPTLHMSKPAPPSLRHCHPYFPHIILFIFIYLLLSDSDRNELAKSNGKFAKYLDKILDVYFGYHHDAYSTKGQSLAKLAFLVH